jgi:hypothetical protein
MPGPVAGPRLADPDGLISAERDDRLVRLLRAASRFLPRDWRLEVIAGRDGRWWHAGPAIDVQLVDHGGRLIAYQTRDQGGPIWREYKKLADLVFHCQRCLYPELEGMLAWGGKFTLATGEWDVTRFDLGGLRGRGRYQPPERAAIPAFIRAKLRGD